MSDKKNEYTEIVEDYLSGPREVLPYEEDFFEKDIKAINAIFRKQDKVKKALKRRERSEKDKNKILTTNKLISRIERFLIDLSLQCNARIEVDAFNVYRIFVAKDVKITIAYSYTGNIRYAPPDTRDYRITYDKASLEKDSKIRDLTWMIKHLEKWKKAK